MDDYQFLIRLENEISNFQVKQGQVKNYWQDHYRFEFYRRVIDPVHPSAINFVGKYKEVRTILDSYLSQIDNMSEI